MLKETLFESLSRDKVLGQLNEIVSVWRQRISDNYKSQTAKLFPHSKAAKNQVIVFSNRFPIRSQVNAIPIHSTNPNPKNNN